MSDDNLKILVVEDEPIFSHMLEKELAKAFTVIDAHNGKKAWETLKAEDIDLIALDLIMPEMDGFELLEKMKEGGYDMPVLVLSALSFQGDKDRAYGLGVKEYFVKGEYRLEDLVRKINKHLKK